MTNRHYKRTSTPNALEDFVSYSYHHTLVLCSNTLVSTSLTFDPGLYELITSESENSASEGGYTVFNRYNKPVETIEGKRVFQTKVTHDIIGNYNNILGKFTLITNGFSDTKYIIQSVNWEVAQVAERGNGVSTSGLKGQMTILEPFGVEFYNVLNKASIDLNTDTSSMIFLLKTTFVGHTGEGEVKVLKNNLPLPFVILGIESDTDSSGTIYQIEFHGVSDGMAKRDSVNTIIKGINLTVKDTMKDAMAHVEQQLNFQYTAYRDALLQTPVDRSGGGGSRTSRQNNRDTIDFLASLKEMKIVRYAIKLDPAYESYLVGTAESDTSKPDPKKAQFTVSIPTEGNVKIEDVILQILNSSADIEEEGIGIRSETLGDMFFPKVLTNIITTENEAIVTFLVQRMRWTFDVWDDTLDETASIDKRNKKRAEMLDRFGRLDFNYIYTGKNNNVLEFNTKQNMGYQFFNFMNVNKVNRESAISYSGASEQKVFSPNGTMASGQDRIIPKTILWPNSQSTDPSIINKQNPARTSTYRSVLQMFSSYNVEQNITIHGNNALMGGVFNLEILDYILAQDKIPEFDAGVAQSQAESLKASKDAQKKFIVQIDMEKNTIDINQSVISNGPLYATLNIQMPTSKEYGDWDLTPEFATPYWYDGPYMILKVENIFDGGSFTQKLQLIAIPMITTSELEYLKESAEAEKILEQRIKDLYNTMVKNTDDEIITDDDTGIITVIDYENGMSIQEKLKWQKHNNRNVEEAENL